MILKDSDVAKISDLVYNNPDYNDINKGYEKEYQFLESSANKDSAEGFFGAAFEKDNKVIIAFRGTNPLNNQNSESLLKSLEQTMRDLEDDWSVLSNRWGISNKPMPQYKEALEFGKAIKQKYGIYKEIIITGHSLGGGMAQLVGIALGYQVISFESPGVLSIARNLFGQDKIDAHKSYITPYATGPNLINTSGKQIKDPVQINVKTSSYGFTDSKIAREFEFLKYTKEQHDSKRIYQAFDPSTGKPYLTVSYDKWPTMKEAYEQFYSQCIHANDPKMEFSAKSNSNDGFNWEGSSPTLNPSGSPQIRKPSARNNPSSKSQSSSGFQKPFTSLKDAFKDTIFEDLRNELPSAGPSSTPSSTTSGNDNARTSFKAGASYTLFKAPFSTPFSGYGNSGASPQPCTNFIAA